MYIYRYIPLINMEPNQEEPVQEQPVPLTGLQAFQEKIRNMSPEEKKQYYQEAKEKRMATKFRNTSRFRQLVEEEVALRMQDKGPVKADSTGHTYIFIDGAPFQSREIPAIRPPSPSTRVLKRSRRLKGPTVTMSTPPARTLMSTPPARTLRPVPSAVQRLLSRIREPPAMEYSDSEYSE